MDKHLVAAVYELKGGREKAISIYRDILKTNPSDKVAEENLRRIATRKIDTKGINGDMLVYFKRATSKAELYELERWLLGN